MNRLQAFVCLAIIVAAASLSRAQAPATQADPAEVAAVRKAADEFIPLLKGNDQAALKNAFGGTDAGLHVALAFRDALNAAQDAKAALVKKFPNDMPPSGVGLDASLLAMIKRMQTQGVTINQDVAIIGNPVGGVALKKIDGVWKVSDLINDPDGKLHMDQILGAIVKVSHEFRGEVDAGKYASLKEATEALTKKMKLATAVFVPKTQTTTDAVK